MRRVFVGDNIKLKRYQNRNDESHDKFYFIIMSKANMVTILISEQEDLEILSGQTTFPMLKITQIMKLNAEIEHYY